jgi:hypothetical protein
LRYFVGLFVAGGPISWQDTGNHGDLLGLTITFRMFHRASPLKAENELAKRLLDNKVEWLCRTQGGLWLFRSEIFKTKFDNLSSEDWLQGDLSLRMDHDVRRETIGGREEDDTICQFVLTPEIVLEQMAKKIFLSHKGVDKQMVRKFKQILEVLGFDPWLDEDAMPAGTNLERGILNGFKQSCAAIFFITPNFADAGYLSTEVDYSIKERRAKGDKFQIITLLLDGADRKQIPELLNSYVWKSPKSELEALGEILRALPISVGQVLWKT